MNKLDESKTNLGPQEQIFYKKPSKEQIKKWEEERAKKVDYEIGDWVETCDMLPGIVQKIDIPKDNVSIFYPHYAFREDCIGEYSGHSNCSIDNCGVHKITPEYAIMLMSLGREILTKRWEELCDSGEEIIYWELEVEKLYKEHFGK